MFNSHICYVGTHICYMYYDNNSHFGLTNKNIIRVLVCSEGREYVNGGARSGRASTLITD